MKRYLLDSNAVSDDIFCRRGVHEKAKQARLNGAKVGTCLSVVAELLGGIENSSTRDVNMVVVNRKLHVYRLWPFTMEAAREYGRLYALLRRSGIKIQTVDMMISAMALSLGKCTVVSSDSDLKKVPGLPVENWADS